MPAGGQRCSVAVLQFESQLFPDELAGSGVALAVGEAGDVAAGGETVERQRGVAVGEADGICLQRQAGKVADVYAGGIETTVAAHFETSSCIAQAGLPGVGCQLADAGLLWLFHHGGIAASDVRPGYRGHVHGDDVTVAVRIAADALVAPHAGSILRTAFSTSLCCLPISSAIASDVMYRVPFQRNIEYAFLSYLSSSLAKVHRKVDKTA